MRTTGRGHPESSVALWVGVVARTRAQRLIRITGTQAVFLIAVSNVRHSDGHHQVHQLPSRDLSQNKDQNGFRKRNLVGLICRSMGRDDGCRAALCGSILELGRPCAGCRECSRGNCAGARLFAVDFQMRSWKQDEYVYHYKRDGWRLAGGGGGYRRAFAAGGGGTAVSIG